jgi:hypothetical protein
LKRVVLVVLCALAAAYALLSAGLYWAMRQPPEVFGRVMSHTPMAAMMILPFEPLWRHAREGPVRVGAPAPDFELPTLDRSARVVLNSFRGVRPVVLVFGSYT